MALTREIYFLPVLEAASETGWDLGPFAAALQCLHLDIPLLENKIKLSGIKNSHVYAQLGQILNLKDTKRPKNHTATFKKPRAKAKYCVCAPCSGYHLRNGQTPKPPLQPDP